MANILVIAAHPDDETLGCGGTILKYSERHDFYCVIMSDGVTSRDCGSGRVMEIRSQGERAAKELGIKEIRFLPYPDAKMDSYPLLSIVKGLEYVIRQLPEADYVFTHHPGDLNIDHRITSQVVQTIFRPVPECGCRGLLYFEIPGATHWVDGFPEFKPTIYVDIAAEMVEKDRILNFYPGELRGKPDFRSLDGIWNLAAFRGTVAGFEHAEAFSVGYWRGDFIDL